MTKGFSVIYVCVPGRQGSCQVRSEGPSPREKNDITGEPGDALKVSLTTPPVDGRAKLGCIKWFAKLLKVARSSVTIASGQTSQNKVIRVAGVTAHCVRDRLRG
jgi:uncharacterized protein (TIGR00251 family)